MRINISYHHDIMGVSAQEQKVVAMHRLISDFNNHFFRLSSGFRVHDNVLSAQR